MIPKRELKLRKEIIIGAIVVIILLIVLAFVYLGANKVKKGDTVSVNYVGSLDNGTVFDTNIEEVALANNINKMQFEPLTFTVGTGQVISGFDDEVVGMAEGDKKKFTIAPEKAYPYNDALVLRSIPRVSEIERFLNVPLTSFSQLFGKQPTVGETLDVEDVPFPMKVMNISEGAVMLEVLLKSGDSVSLPGTAWKSDVTAVNQESFTIKQNPEVGLSYFLPQPNGVVAGKVIRVDENTFDVDTNPPIAGKALTFEVTILEIKE